MQKEIEVIQEPCNEKPFIVIKKPKGLPSAPLSKDDKDNALFKAMELFPSTNKVRGKKEIEYGLLHRLDTATEGLLLIAANQDSYDSLVEQQNNNLFIKEYKAYCNFLCKNVESLQGFPKHNIDISSSNEIICSSYFRNYGTAFKEVRPVTEKSGKAALKKTGTKKIYTTKIKIVSASNNLNENSELEIKCRITSGYRHQVRCHLAWLNMPVKGDFLYNYLYKGSNNILDLQFYATGLEFINPKTKEKEQFFL